MKWISVKDELPLKGNRSPLVLGFDGKQKHLVHYFPSRFKTVEIDDWDDVDESDDVESDENTGSVWLKEGWYEDCEQVRGDYDYAWIKREITHWMPLPEPPKTTNP